jgi:protein-tyrosine phosphatase
MIDLHCHFLPGIDDGARTPEETSAMLEIAASSGTAHLVATPHADDHYCYEPERVDELLEQARALAPPGLRLYRGCDFHLMMDNLTDAIAHPRRYTLNASRYLLVELSDLIIFPNTGEMFDRLEQAGMVVIVSHPERNPILGHRTDLAGLWVEQGRLLQVTASSLLGQWGPRVQKFARWLLEQGLVHFVASDGHNVRGRPPRLDQARAWLEREYGAGLAARLLETNPLAVIEDRPLEPPEVVNCKPVASGRSFWRRLFNRSRTQSAPPRVVPKS